jgi:cell division protein FtsL
MDANRIKYQYESTRTSYVEGNTVRKLNTAPDIRREEEQYERPSRRRQVHQQPKTLQGISPAALLVLTIAIAATLYICVEYLRLQSDVTQMDKTIVSLEQNLITMSKENDAAYAEIDTSVDLAHIYKVAVEKLGMVYPNNNTVIAYKSAPDDYVRQYEDIPD